MSTRVEEQKKQRLMRKGVHAGFNAWTDVNYAAYKAAQSLSSSVNIGSQNDEVALYFKNAAAAGFNTVRIFGHGNSTSFALQKGPGLLLLIGLHSPRLLWAESFADTEIMVSDGLLMMSTYTCCDSLRPDLVIRSSFSQV